MGVGERDGKRVKEDVAPCLGQNPLKLGSSEGEGETVGEECEGGRSRSGRERGVGAYSGERQECGEGSRSRGGAGA